MLEFVIDDPNATEGDIGDVFYDQIKVADIILEEDNLKIVFLNGEENSIMELMPSIFTIAQYM